MPDLMLALNEQVKLVAGQYRLRTRNLEDGELVIALPGKDLAHAGGWDEGAWYLLVPCSSPARREAILKKLSPDLKSRSGDIELLMIGDRDEIVRLLLRGPSWCRARRRRAAVTPSHLLAHLFPPTVGAQATYRGSELSA